METNKLAEAEDLANLLVYRMKDTPDCELTQHCVDLFRELVHELIIENRILEEDAKFQPGLHFKVNAE